MKQTKTAVERGNGLRGRLIIIFILHDRYAALIALN